MNHFITLLLTLFFLFINTNYAFTQNARQLDSLALVAFANSTNYTTWDFTQPMSEWLGIGLTRSGRVGAIVLYNENLTGILPTEIGQLTELEYIDLSNNQIGGSIPLEIGNWTKAEFLLFRNNQFTGSIPNSIGGLQKLNRLSFSENQLSGRIPKELFLLPALQHLFLSKNQLSGSLPPEFGSMNDPAVVFIDHNQLSGTIPESIGNIGHLLTLNLSFNQLSGTIPKTIGNASISSLLLNDNNLSGEIPAELGNMERSTTLWLQNNQLTGSIPAFIAAAQDLENGPRFSILGDVNVSNNQLSGVIPAVFADISTVTLSDGIPRYLTFDFSLNTYTFEDILPFYIQNSSPNVMYNPQDTIGQAKEFNLTANTTFTYDLQVDEQITDNIYIWYKNGQFHQENIGDNDLTFANLTSNDTGIYHCEITNPRVPDLTLLTYPITLNVAGCNLTPGASCDDNDPATENDIVSENGCQCQGTPVIPSCARIGINVENNQLILSNLTAPNIITKIFAIDATTGAWSEVFQCLADCEATVTVSNLAAGKYVYSVQFFDENWQSICETGLQEIIVTAGNDGEDCTDADEDGICESEDCNDNNPAVPAMVGTPCDDNDTTTTEDQIQADGCTCAGINDDGEGNMEGADIAVELRVNTSNPALYQNVVYTLLATNRGTTPMTEVQVNFDYGAQVTSKAFALTAPLPVADYNSWTGEWKVGDLAVNETKTLRVTLFVLQPAAPQTTLAAELIHASPIDVQSDNNYSETTIQIGDNLQGNATSRLMTTPILRNSQQLEILSIAPNPATERIWVNIYQPNLAAETQALQLYDAQGQKVMEQAVQLDTGLQQVRLDVQSLAVGIYTLQLVGAYSRAIPLRVVKMD